MCSKCTENHSLKDASEENFKCINCLNIIYMKWNKGSNIDVNHLTLMLTPLAIKQHWEPTDWTSIIVIMYSLKCDQMNSHSHQQLALMLAQTNPVQTKCMQINLQHSWNATNKLMRIVEEDNIDLILIQEPYTIRKRVMGILKNSRGHSIQSGLNLPTIMVSNFL